MEGGRLKSELAAEVKGLGLGDCPNFHLSENGTVPLGPPLAPGKLRSLRRPAKLLREARQRSAAAESAAAAAASLLEPLAEQIHSALSANGDRDLTAALDRAGNLVSQFRRRAQLDERLGELARHRAELEERQRHLEQRELLPMSVLVALGAVIVVGVVLLLSGMLMPASFVGTAGWTLALFGLALGGAAVGAKLMLERSNHGQLAACETRLELVRSQVRQAEEDRAALDARAPAAAAGGRLQAAEKSWRRWKRWRRWRPAGRRPPKRRNRLRAARNRRCEN